MSGDPKWEGFEEKYRPGSNGKTLMNGWVKDRIRSSPHYGGEGVALDAMPACGRSIRRGIPLLKPGRLLRCFLGKRGIAAKQEAMISDWHGRVSSDDTNETSDVARRRRRRSNSLLLVWPLIVWHRRGRTVLCVAAGNLRLRPDCREATITRFRRWPGPSPTAGRSGCLRSRPTGGRSPRPAWCCKADLAVGRGDLEMRPTRRPSRSCKNSLSVVAFGLAGKAPKESPRRKSRRSRGQTVGVIGRMLANAALLRVILTSGGGAAAGYAIWHGPNRGAGARLDWMHSWRSVARQQITSDAIAATAGAGGRSSAIRHRKPSPEAPAL